MTIKSVAPYTTVLHEGNAYWMARLCKEIYLKTSADNELPDESSILASIKGDDNGFISVFAVDKNSAQGALIEHQDYLCLTFRGTNEVADWLDNINAFCTRQLFGEFHRGFWQSTEDVWPLLIEQYQLCQAQKKRPVFITGHSLGGAMATIAAAKFIQLDQAFTSVYTFGQPRVLSRDTARIYNIECKSRSFRFHNNNDIVTRVPARFMGYSHGGSYLYITQEQTIKSEAGFWFKFIDHFDGAFNALREQGIDAIADHDMHHYLEAVEKWDIET
jgi:triacylglycerol lipase